MEEIREKFKAKNVEYELYTGSDGHIEVYDDNDPANGMIFDDKKCFFSFLNSLSDLVEKLEMEK